MIQYSLQLQLIIVPSNIDEANPNSVEFIFKLHTGLEFTIFYDPLDFNRLGKERATRKAFHRAVEQMELGGSTSPSPSGGKVLEINQFRRAA